MVVGSVLLLSPAAGRLAYLAAFAAKKYAIMFFKWAVDYNPNLDPKPPGRESFFWRLRAKSKMVVGFYQILFSLTTTLIIRWPPFTLKFFGYLKILSLNLPGLPFMGCLGRNSFMGSFWGMVLGPMLIVAGLFLLQYAEKISREKAWKFTIYLLFMTYPTTCEYIVRAFQCYEMADGTEYLQGDFSQPCDNRFKSTVWPLAATCFIIICVGVPVVMFGRLYKYREALFDPRGHRNVRGQPTEPMPGPDWQLGFLYRVYRPQYFWFEIAELVKKFLLCACLRFVFPGTASQIVIGIMFVSMYMLMVAWFSPYKQDSDNLFSTIIQVVAAACPSVVRTAIAWFRRWPPPAHTHAPHLSAAPAE